MHPPRCLQVSPAPDRLHCRPRRPTQPPPSPAFQQWSWRPTAKSRQRALHAARHPSWLASPAISHEVVGLAVVGAARAALVLQKLGSVSIAVPPAPLLDVPPAAVVAAAAVDVDGDEAAAAAAADIGGGGAAANIVATKAAARHPTGPAAVAPRGKGLQLLPCAGPRSCFPLAWNCREAHPEHPGVHPYRPEAYPLCPQLQVLPSPA
eukprot:237911-Pelagomonas_calceolata.AAC.2